MAGDTTWRGRRQDLDGSGRRGAGAQRSSTLQRASCKGSFRGVAGVPRAGEIRCQCAARSPRGARQDCRVTSRRRQVRVGEGFFRRLEEQLGPERGPSGEPSLTDFLVRELPDVVERLATDSDGLPEAVEGFSRSRMLIARGLLVRAFAVYSPNTGSIYRCQHGLSPDRAARGAASIRGPLHRDLFSRVEEASPVLGLCASRCRSSASGSPTGDPQPSPGADRRTEYPVLGGPSWAG